MIIECRCDSCGAKIRVAEKHLGRKAKCPRCSRTFEVAQRGDPAPVTSPDTAIESQPSHGQPTVPRGSADALDTTSPAFPEITTEPRTAGRLRNGARSKAGTRGRRSSPILVIGGSIAGIVSLVAVATLIVMLRARTETTIGRDASSPSETRRAIAPPPSGLGDIINEDGRASADSTSGRRAPPNGLSSPRSMAAATKSSGQGGWSQDFEAAKQSAFVEKKDVLVAFVGSDWSALSQSLTREVFSSDRFLRFCDSRFVLVRVDLPRGELARQQLSDPGQNEYLLRHFRPLDLPSTVLTDAYGRPYARLEGYDAAGPAAFVARLERADADRQRWRELTETIAEASGGDLLTAAVEAVDWLQDRRLLRHYEPELQRLFGLALKSDPHDSSGQHETLFSAYWLSRMINADDAGHLAEIRELANELDRWSREHTFRDPNREGELCLTAATALAKCDLPDRAQDFIDRALAAGPKAPQLLDRLKGFSRNLRRTLSSGSGFVVTTAGHVLTNLHVIDGPGEIAVRLPGSEEQATARVLAKDAARDMALLAVELPGAESLMPLAVSTAEVNRGSPVAVFGFPLGDAAGSGLKLTTGVVSGLPDSSPEEMLLLDCRVNPGNSGGPLCNQYGQVIGMVSKKRSGGVNVDSYGMALPADELRDFLRKHIPNFEAAAVGAETRMQWDEVDRLVSPAVLMILKLK